MTDKSLEDFLDRKPWLKTIREKGVIEAVKQYRDRLPDETREKLDYLFSKERRLSIAYRGCMICKEIASAGIWKEIDQLHNLLLCRSDFFRALDLDRNMDNIVLSD